MQDFGLFSLSAFWTFHSYTEQHLRQEQDLIVFQELFFWLQYSDETPLMAAARKGCMEIVGKLIRHGASVNLTDKVDQISFQSVYSIVWKIGIYQHQSRSKLFKGGVAKVWDVACVSTQCFGRLGHAPVWNFY